MRANQLRLWFASMAYVLISALRRMGLTHTPFARASCGTIRLKLLKIGALVLTSVRRISSEPFGLPISGRVPCRPCRAHRRRALTPTRKHEPEKTAKITPPRISAL